MLYNNVYNLLISKYIITFVEIFIKSFIIMFIKFKKEKPNNFELIKNLIFKA